MQFYQDEFEEPFLQDVGDYYRLLSVRLVNELSSSDYIKKVSLFVRNLLNSL